MLHAEDTIATTVRETAAPRITRIAALTFAALFAMNLLDYIDRNILSAVLPQLRQPVEKGGLGLDTVQSGWLPTFFLISYSVICPLMGWAGDRFRRTWLLGIGVGVWSLATVGSGFAANYGQLVFARSLLGIGEATYGIIAPTVLVDLFSRDQRSRVLSYFYLAMPVGSALGIVLGGNIAERYGWRNAFFLVGLPGLAAALVAFFLPEPIRGASEKIDPERLREHEQSGASLADYRDLMVNSSYTYSVMGMAFYTFAIGGLVYWIPYYLTITRGIPQGRATLILGLVTLAAAAGGMSIGGIVSDRLAKVDPRALFLVPGFALIGAVPFVLLGLFSTTPVWIFVGIFFAEALMFVNTGPCNTIIVNVVSPNLRSSAFAIAIAAIHVFGDFWSNPLIGWVAQTFGQKDTMDSVFGRALASVGAVPTQPPGQAPENIVAGLLVVVPAILLAGVVLLSGARHLPREMALMLAKLKAAPQKHG